MSTTYGRVSNPIESGEIDVRTSPGHSWLITMIQVFVPAVVIFLLLTPETLLTTPFSPDPTDASGCSGGLDGVLRLGDQGRSHRGCAQRFGAALGRPGRASGTARGELRGTISPPILEIISPNAGFTDTRVIIVCKSSSMCRGFPPKPCGQVPCLLLWKLIILSGCVDHIKWLCESS